MNTGTNSDKLAALLSAELETLQALDAALDLEHQALTGSDASQLEQATAAKSTAIMTHQAQQEQRITWMRTLGFSAETPLSDLVAHCDANPSNTALQNQLSALASQCQSNNRRNGGLILRLQERTRGALDVLRHDEGGPDLYSLSGSREHQSDSRTLGKA